MPGYDSAPTEALVGFIFWLNLPKGECFPTNSWLAQDLIWPFSLQLWILTISQDEVTL